jgi:hypothetical protein
MKLKYHAIHHINCHEDSLIIAITIRLTKCCSKWQDLLLALLIFGPFMK